MVRERNRGKLALAVVGAVVLLVIVGVVLRRNAAWFSSHSDDNAAASVSAEQESDVSAEGSANAEALGDASEAAPEKTFTVCVDAGHGGKDAGCNTDTRLEKDDNLAIALALRDSLEARGIQVLMTRDTDVFVDLYDRCDIANEANADCFISLHRNAAGGQGYGVEVWKSTTADETESLLADTIDAALEQVGVQRNRGIFIGSANNPEVDDVVLRETTMPSVIVETGFVDNSADNDYFDQHMTEYADAIADSVVKVFSDQIPGASDTEE